MQIESPDAQSCPLPLSKFLPRVLLTVTNPNQPASQSRTIIVFDPNYPVPIPCPGSEGTIFADSFGINFCDENGVQHVRAADLSEMLRCCSFPEDVIISLSQSSSVFDAVHVLPFGFPFAFANTFALHIFDLGVFPCDLCLSFSEDIIHSMPVCCMFYSPNKNPPSAADWTAAYDADPETKLIIQSLVSTAGAASDFWSRDKLMQLHPQFRDSVRSGAVNLLQNKLVLFQTLQPSVDSQLMLIVVPSLLRRPSST